MALHFFDGFDARVPTLGYGKWTNQIAPAAFDTGRVGGSSLRIAGSPYGNGAGLQYILSSGSINEWVMGMACYEAASPYYDVPLLSFHTGTNPSSFELQIQHGNGGYVKVVRGDNVVLGQTSQPVFLPVRWLYLEVKVKIAADTTGYVTVRVDGSVVLNLTGVRTAASASPAVNMVMLGAYLGNINFKLLVDDFYLCDTTGTSFNDFLGDVVVYTQVPTADATYNDWTPNTGTNRYSCVQEIPPDGDTTYIYTSSDLAKQTFTFPALSNINVLAVQFSAQARKDDSTTRYLKLIGKLGASEVISSAFTLSNSYLYNVMKFINAPDGTPWTLTKLNSCEFGVMHTLAP